MKLAFGLDLNKCTGCGSCQIACNNENNLPPATRWRQIIVFNRQKLPHLPVISYSMACNHCVEPPCHKHCPAQAYEINEQTGVVTINPDKCMGCKYCQWVCPYDAPTYDASVSVMRKCTFCSHLPDAEEPMCVNACPTGALALDSYKEDRGEEESVPDIWRSHIKPALMVKPVNEDALVPKYSRNNDNAWLNQFLGNFKRKPESAVSLKTEWSLLVFTMCAPLLVAAFAAQALNRSDFPPLVYALIGFLCMAISTLHLGRRTRCCRALLNWKRSWLSREIIFLSVFLFASPVILFTRIQMPILNYSILIIGILALFAIDQVYLSD